MGYLTDHFEPKHAMGFFEDIAAIPHTSGNEAALRSYISDIARTHGHEFHVDEAGNMMVYVKATGGYDSVPPVLLQAHMDMVGVKVPESKHDFLKDPIELVYDGNIVRANGTTLGADNAVGLVNMLALMVDETVVHPPLELLFTVEEESGLVGIRKVDFSAIRSRKMINMDVGDCDTMGVSSAGSIVYRLKLPAKREPAEGTEPYDLHTFGLTGGHGGLCIGFGRASAIVITARMLRALIAQIPELRVYSVDRPLSRSIASEADCIIAISKANVEKAKGIIAGCLRKYREEFGFADPNMDIELVQAQKPAFDPMDGATTRALTDFLSLMPCGVEKRSPDNHDVVLCSNNMDGIATDAECVTLFGQIRASVDAYKDDLFERVNVICRLCGVEVIVDDQYFGWPYKGENTFQRMCKDVYRRLHGCDIAIERANSCAEPGFIVAAIPDMEALCVCPHSKGAHSAKEYMDASTFQPFWLLLTGLLKEVCLNG